MLYYMKWIKEFVIDQNQPLSSSFLPELSSKQQIQDYSDYCLNKIRNSIMTDKVLSKWKIFHILLFERKWRIICRIMFFILLLIVSRCLSSVFLAELIRANDNGDELTYMLQLGVILGVLNISSVFGLHHFRY
jgi:hypothetical protein